MANLADAVLKTLQFAYSGNDSAERELNQQAVRQNHEIELAQRDKDIATRLEGSEMAQFIKYGDPKDRTKPLMEFDVIEAYNKNPQMTMEVFGTYSDKLYEARDEKGNKINIKPVAIEPVQIEGQEMFAVKVERPDGKRAPLTRNGTPAYDDNVILMTRDELNGLATQRLLSMRNRDAFSNGASFARAFAQIPDAAGLRRAAEDQAVRDEVTKLFEQDSEGKLDPGAIREFLELVSSAEDAREGTLREIAADMGIDVDAVIAGLQADAEDAAPEEDTVTPPPGVQPRTPTGEPPAGPAAIPGVRPATGAVSPGFRGPPGVGPAGGTGGVTPEQRAAGAEFFGGLVQKAQASPVFKAAADYVSGALAPDSTKSSVTPELAAAPQPVQQAVLDTDLSPEDRRNAILGAIEQGLQAPTEQQRAVARDFMINNKVQSPQDLSALPGPEVMNLAWVLASADANLTVSERMKVAQGVINFAQFGDTETSARDVATDQFNRQKFAIEQQADLETRMLRAAELERNLGADSTKAIEARRKLGAEANEFVTEVRKGIPRTKDGRIKDRPSPEADIALGQIMTSYETAVRIGDKEAQVMYARALDDAIADYVAAFVIAEPASFWDQFGFAGVSAENVMNLLARKSFRSLKADFGDFIIERNDRVSDEYPNGEPTKLALVTPSGQKAEKGVINLSRLRDRLGEPEFTYFMEMLERQEAANASKRSK